MMVSRRGFMGGMGLAAVAAGIPEILRASDAGAGKPDSCFDGVQIGTITYSYRSMPQSAEKVLKYIVESGISSVELMGDTAESFAGVKTNAQRLAAPMAKFEELRKMYEAAGVKIHIVKFGNIGGKGVPDGINEYYFKVAQALGATGITRELDEAAAKRIAPMADKYRIYVGFHNHTQIRPDTYDNGKVLSYGKYLGINLDVGHFVAANDADPLAVIEKWHSRIISLHMKDRTTKAHGAKNLPWGQGDTPIAKVLKLLRDKKYTFPVEVELEYAVPKDSDAVKEVAKCVRFCKKALASN